MPILWCYILKNFFKIFLFCVIGLVSSFIAMKTQEIARFAAFGASWSSIVVFVACQIPYILSMIIPIASLIASMLLFEQLNNTKELIAFRTSGLSIATLSIPIVMIAFLLSIGNFVIMAEFSPRCRLYSHHLVQNISITNPFLLIKKTGLRKLKNSYIDMNVTRLKKEAGDVVVVLNNHSYNRLSLMVAKKLMMNNNLMFGEQVSLISHIAQNDLTLYDDLIIENQETMSTSIDVLFALMQRPLDMFELKYFSLKHLFFLLSATTSSSLMIKKAQFEVCRRLFFSCITFFFMLLGLFLGMQVGRIHKKQALCTAVFLVSFTFICAMAAKSFSLFFYNMLLLYLLPIFVLILAFWRLWQSILNGVK